MQRGVYVDLDGVIFDFDSYYTQVTGIAWNDRSSMTSRQKWDSLRAADPLFYRNLPLMPGAMELWEFLQPWAPSILSACSTRVPDSFQHKLDAVEKHLHLTGERVIIVWSREAKPQYCSPGDILIDDQQRNIDAWNTEGGYGVLFKSAGQVIAELQELLLP